LTSLLDGIERTVK